MKISTLGIFFLILLEYACFPISSEIVLPFAGGVAAGLKTPFLFLLIVSIVAGLIGTSITYAIGRYGGSPLLDRLMKRFPKTASPILASYRFFGDHGRGAVCLGRVIPICRTYIAFVAGAALTPYSSFLIFSSIGIGVWNLVLLSVGYYFYQYRHLIPSLYEKYKLLILFAAGTLLVLFLIRHFTKVQDD
ncbi:MAG: DedA family protein [Lachnospiraceae bacterium]|nr:DedA family protein [Lachnospiraceae bacterium]